MKRLTYLIAAASIALCFHATAKEAAAQTAPPQSIAAQSYSRCSYQLPDGYSLRIFVATPYDGDQLTFDPNASAANAIAVIAKVSRPTSGQSIKGGTYQVTFSAEATGTVSSSAELTCNSYAGGSVDSSLYAYAESETFFLALATGDAPQGSATTNWKPVT